jgi:hypothetical protein
MMVTSDHNEKNQSNVLQEILISGDYLVDNNLLPENIAKNKSNHLKSSNRYDNNVNNHSNENSQDTINDRTPKINSIKSFQNGYFNLNVSL